MYLTDLSLDELGDEIATLASHIYAGTCRWLEMVAELDRRGGFAGSTVAEWLAWRCALSPRAAREHLRVARRLGELPRIHEAFACGELSYAKVRALARVAEADNEEELLELARHLTASQLERAVRAYRQVTAKEADDLHALAYAGFTWDADGSLIVRAQLAPEDGALFVRALEASRDRLQEAERGSAEPRRPTAAEALVAMADMSLADGSERSGGERYQVVVHVEANDGGSVLEDGSALAPGDRGPHVRVRGRRPDGPRSRSRRVSVPAKTELRRQGSRARRPRPRGARRTSRPSSRTRVTRRRSAASG